MATVISFSHQYTAEGVRICPAMCRGKERMPISLPISFSLQQLKWMKKAPARVMGQFNALQEIWLAGLLQEEAEDFPRLDEETENTNRQRKAYILPYEQVYSLEEEIRAQLELPTIRNVIMTLRSVGHVGDENMRIEIDLHDEVLKTPIHCLRRNGPVIETHTGVYLLPQSMHEILSIADSYPEPTLENQFAYVAKIKKAANDAGAVLDEYLTHEEVVFPEKVTLNADLIDPRQIELRAVVDQVAPSMQEQVFEAARHGRSFANQITDAGTRKRVLIQNALQDELKKMEHVRRIVGSDVPRLVDNPISFMPESSRISIEDFSKRVRDLEIVTYRAQPFIRVRESGKRGWFEVETGVRVEANGMDASDVSKEKHEDTDVGDPQADLFSDGLYEKLVEQARREGDDYVYDQSMERWIRVPEEEATSYLAARDDLKRVMEDGLVNAVKLPYVLRIFDNLSDLEYDEQTIDIKRQFLTPEDVDDRNPSPLLPHVHLHEYQKEGYRWLRVLNAARVGGLLADDMGLGKTLQVITFLAYLYEIQTMNHVLVVAPLTLLENWKNEILKFTSGLGKVLIHQGTGRTRVREVVESHDIVMTTYETLVRDQLLFGQIDWNVMIVDEAQKIKNSTTMASNVVKAMKANMRLALTGTPVENGLNELWCIIDFIQPGLLGAYKEFRSQYELPIQRNASETEQVRMLTEELQSRIQSVYLRRTKEDRLAGLPEKREHKISITMSKEQQIMYLEVIRRYKEKDYNFFGALSRLMQLCSHPALVKGADETVNKANIPRMLRQSPKLNETMDILKQVQKKGEKAIVFTKYRKMQQILCAVIQNLFDIYPLVINGDVVENRLGIVKSFEQQQGFHVAVLSPRAAGVGLTITGANHVIHYTREWNPAVEAQATDRVYRIGQEKTVNVYYPITVLKEGTSVEVRLDELLAEKKKLIQHVIIPKESLNITEKDFAGMM